MKQTVAYISSCALDRAGRPTPFTALELPWLFARFDRVLLCGPTGVAEITEARPMQIKTRRPAPGGLRAWLRAPFFTEFRKELHHLRADGKRTPIAGIKLLLFTVRGFRLHYWLETMLDENEATTLYSFWMSYDGFAAALCKRKHPAFRAVARGHAFDIDPGRNPMNPYLMKRFMVETLDGLYPIGEDAKRKVLQCVPVPEAKLTVLRLGSMGGRAVAHRPAPRYTDGILHVVSCSSLIPEKQVPVLIDALAGWQTAPVRWTHIGGGAREEALRTYAEKMLGGRPDIAWRITGVLEPKQVQAIYDAEAFDVFINVSRSEGVPVSIMEAMRAGIPVIAPAVGGIPGMVDEQVGRLFAPEDGAGAVRQALTWLWRLDPEADEALRTAAQARWNTHFRSETLLYELFPKVKKGAVEE